MADANFLRKTLGKGATLPDDDSYWLTQGAPGLPPPKSQTFGSTPTQTTNPEMPNMPPPQAPAGGSGMEQWRPSLWSRILGLMGAGGSNPEAGANWMETSTGPGHIWRNNVRGFDIFGLAPQEVYWTNLQGASPEDFARAAPANQITPEKRWANLQTPGAWGAHEDARAPGVAPDWLKQDLDALQGVWSQLSESERQLMRDRMLLGAGLPDYAKLFQASRPQWINDYISNTFTV